MERLTELLRAIKPYVLGWISATGGGSGPFAPSPHDLNSAHHSGSIADLQAPQFLLSNGGRTLTGNLPVSSGVTIDGVDLSAFNAEAFVTLGNTAGLPNERALTAGSGISLTDGGAGGAATVAVDASVARNTWAVNAGAGLTGGGNLASGGITLNVGAGAGITVNADDVALTTPGSLSATSTNSATGNHTHAIDGTIARSAITVTGSGALGGGGDLTANRTITLNTPGTLTVSSSNSSTTNHTHAITSSSNPGAAASILATDANGRLSLSVSPNANANVVTRGYVTSRGMNLVANGTGLMGTNYNFSALTLDQADTHGTPGAFLHTGDFTTVTSDEYIPIDASRWYQSSLWLKNGDQDGSNYHSSATLFAGFVSYDADLLLISAYHIMRYGSSALTTLAQALNPGDTVMVLTDATGWQNGGGTSLYYQGYSYPNYTYSRNTSLSYSVYTTGGVGMWADGGISGNTVTLTAPWPGPALPAGTPVRNASSSSTYDYFIVSGANPPQNVWTNYTGRIGPGTTPGWSGSANEFRPGVAYVKFLLLVNFGLSGGTNHQRIAGIWVSEISSGNIEAATASIPGVVSTNTQTFAGNKTFNNNVLVSGSVGIGTTSPAATLHTLLNNATTNAVDTLATWAHNSTSTPAAGFGTRHLWTLKSSTTTDQNAAALDVSWSTATHDSRVSDMSLSAAYSGGLSEFLRGRGGASALIGFLGATPIARYSATGDLRQALIDFGLYTTGGASPLNLNGGALTAGSISTTSVGSHLIPTLTDTYDLGSSSKLWRKGWLSELDTIVFAQNTMTLQGGMWLICKDSGVLPADSGNGATIDFGKAMTQDDFVLFRSSLAVEYVQVGTLVSGTTYNVTRNLDGSGANNWPAGSPFAVLGGANEWRIEAVAGASPRLSLIEQRQDYNSVNEAFRIGDLSGLPGVTSGSFGIFIGSEAQHLKYTGGVLEIAGDGSGLTRIDGGNIQAGTITSSRIAAGTIAGDRLSLTSFLAINSTTFGTDGVQLQYNSGDPRAYIGNGSDRFFKFDGVDVSWQGANTSLTAAGLFTASNANITGAITATSGDLGALSVSGKLTMGGAGSAIAIGTTPPTSSTSGTGLWIDRTGYYGLSSGVYQVKIDATDGKLYAGGGHIILDSAGISVNSAASFKFKYLGSTVGQIVMKGPGDYTASYTLQIEGYRTAVNRSAVSLVARTSAGGNQASINVEQVSGVGSITAVVDDTGIVSIATGGVIVNGGLNVGADHGAPDGDLRLSGSISKSTAIAARVYNSSGQTIGNASWTALTFNSERFDNAGLHSTSSNTSRLVAPVAGDYVITGVVRWNNNDTGLRGIAVRLNGTTFISESLVYTSSVHTSNTAGIYHLAENDYVELMVYQSSGGNLNTIVSGNISPEFAMARLA